MSEIRWVQTEDQELKEMSAKALNCRATGRHYFGDLAAALRAADKVVIVKIGSVTLERACVGRCGVYEVVEWNLRGKVVSRKLDYKRAVDKDGNSTYLLPKGSGRLHPDEARGELFKRLGFGA